MSSSSAYVEMMNLLRLIEKETQEHAAAERGLLSDVSVEAVQQQNLILKETHKLSEELRNTNFEQDFRDIKSQIESFPKICNLSAQTLVWLGIHRELLRQLEIMPLLPDGLLPDHQMKLDELLKSGGPQNLQVDMKSLLEYYRTTQAASMEMLNALAEYLLEGEQEH